MPNVIISDPQRLGRVAGIWTTLVAASAQSTSRMGGRSPSRSGWLGLLVSERFAMAGRDGWVWLLWLWKRLALNGHLCRTHWVTGAGWRIPESRSLVWKRTRGTSSLPAILIWPTIPIRFFLQNIITTTAASSSPLDGREGVGEKGSPRAHGGIPP